MSTTPNGNGSAMTVREEFGATEIATQAETSSAAVAAQATAEVQARYVMALKRPRDWDVVRSKLLRDCQRPGFAAVARYSKPIGGGKKAEGPSIRFAEAAIRAMTNLLPSSTVILDDHEKRIVRVSLTDLEANVSYFKDVTIPKTVERRYLKDGQTPLRTRINSEGKPTYLVEATDEDLLNKQNALESKALRGHATRILPGDILDDCMTMVMQTLRNEDARDPDAAKKKILDAFVAVNVSPDMLKAYLGHEIGTSSPAELEELRGIYTALKDGETSWSSVMETKTGGEKAEAKTDAPKTTADLVKKHKAKKDETKTEASGACEACGSSSGHVPNCPEADPT